jgi:Ricin-type beta-trefoil lectin domain-like
MTKPSRSKSKRKKVSAKSPWLSRNRLIAGLCIVIFAAVGGGYALMSSSAAAEKQLDTAQAMYPRAIRLQNSGTANGRILATTATASIPGGVIDTTKIYESTDSGVNFHSIGQIQDPQAANGRGSCCGSIYELPKAAGAQPAGTLLYGTTVGMPNKPDRKPEIRVWKSTDHGYTWSYFSSCATAPNAAPGRGLWEPEFSMDARGYLECFFSDDTQFDETTKTGYDQVLASVTSTDGGATWGPQQNVVALASSGATTTRPGMAVVRKLPNGTYFMSYEVCGSRPDACVTHFRTSADGWQWGDPTDLGQIPQTPDGKRFFHAPTVAWAAGGTNGRILLIGGLVKDSAGNIMRPASGTTIFANTESGVGGWYEIPSPVAVSFSATPTSEEMVCNNYSSSLLPSTDGASVFEVATKRNADGLCQAYFNNASLKGSGTATGITTGSVYRFYNTRSSQCLDVSKGSTSNYGNVQQWTCNNLAPQNWTVVSKGSGYYTLKSKQSGKCLEVYKSSLSNGANVDQYTCGTSSNQYWKISSVGRNYYTLTNKKSGKCLEVKSGSLTAGANAQQYTCNGTEAQLWEGELR